MENIKLQAVIFVIFVIFGATGDLNWRKVNPALYNLFLDHWLPEHFAIIGTGRSKLSDEDFRQKLLAGVNQFSRKGNADPASWDKFSNKLTYQATDINDEGTYQGETPDAYETLLLDAIEGDQTLFMRADQVEAAWALLMPVLNSWQSKPNLDFSNYSAGSWGPELAEALIARDGFHWFSLPEAANRKS